MTALHALDAATLATLYRRGELSPVEATRAVIERVECLEPTLHATWGFDPEGALAAAAESEERHRRGRPLSALDGVPAMLKENIGTRGWPKPLGCAAVEAAPEAEDSPPAARLREAGCVFVARTTMPDYGMLSSGLSSLHAAARNPWNPALTPGGSSAGAGAGAAAGYGPLHVGTDIGGSIRLPAGWCGVVGFKPSLGRVPIVPPYAGRCAGPITRTVADAALLMAELSRPDARDATSLPPQAIVWDRLDDLELRGLRLGLLLDAGWGLAPEPRHVEIVTAAARAFEAAGCIVEPLAPFTTPAMADGIDLFWRMRSWLDLQALPPERRERVLPFIRDWAGRGAGYSAAQVFHGQAQMAALRDAAVAACSRFDFVLSPVAPVPAFPALHASPTNDPARAMAHIGFTLPFNMSEQPAIAVPAGMTADGLPVGLQIAGRRHDDLGVLRLARAWERLRPPLPAGPPI
ncbi:amidase [Rubrivivax gelatinosus]|uniref:Putative amidase family protein n=1 Tax=Rubrivivax gelatinosus (strain NBRC 100245 / IL144) TaxID=983917 RepID=I0HKJ2_RUBGI|nr:amidase [Rubrivivax gelatinosus]BAL93529.1 putative amidase family protein [Rubrivivax gelatinosus IL144]